jgi:DNA-directed RNA polymerase subunit K/omega
MKFIAIEKIWEKYDNKYIALIRAAKEARRVIEGMEKNEIQIEDNPYRHALKLITEDKKVEKTEEKEETKT